MDDEQKLPPVTDEMLALYRRCRFAHREFWPRDCYKTRKPPEDPLAFIDEMHAKEEEFLEDPERFEVIEGGWDHEHCDVCWLRIDPGDWYTPILRGSGVSACTPCHLAETGRRRTSESVTPAHDPTKLRRLYLQHAKVTDAGLKYLARCSGLKILNLSSRPITDSGLQNLAKLAALEELHVARTCITDSGLIHLRRLKSLKRLDLTETRVTNKGVTRLKRDCVA
jgi:Leucine Rich Repeat (LRR) protein